MKRILIVGAGYDQTFAIRAAKDMGHEVLTVDINPQAPGVQWADKFEQISIVDEEGITEYARREQVDGITTVASEKCIPLIAKICKKLNLPGISPETARLATNKIAMKKRFAERGVTTAAFAEIRTYNELEAFIDRHAGPWVIKPSDSSGQRGIEMFDQRDHLLEYYEEARKYATDGEAIVEQYIEGPEINVCAVVMDGDVKLLSLSDRITDIKNFGIAIKHLVPANLAAEGYDAVAKESIKAIRAIDMETGIAYPQVLMSKEGPYVVEIAARMPGGNNREIAMYTSGIDMVRVAVWQALGEHPSWEEMVTEEIHPATCVRFITRNDIPPQIRQVSSLQGLDEAASSEGMKELFMFLKEGDTVPDLATSGARFGGLIAVGNDRQQAADRAEQAYKKILIE